MMFKILHLKLYFEHLCCHFLVDCYHHRCRFFRCRFELIAVAVAVAVVTVSSAAALS
jgi:hypothetical protein